MQHGGPRTAPAETQTMYTDGKGNFWADPLPGLTEVEVDSHGQPVGTPGAAEPAPAFAKYVRGARDVTAMHHTEDGAALRDALDTHETMPLGTADTVSPDLRKALRERTGVSLDSLAQAIGLPYETVRGYEEGVTWEDALGLGRAYGSFLDASYRDAAANGEVK